MSWKLTIEIPDSKLLSALKLLKGYRVEVEQTIEVNGTALKQLAPDSRVTPQSHIRLGTNREVNEGTLHDKIIQIVEKYETRNGAGSMTRAELTKALARHSEAPHAAIGAALKSNVITGA
jgi:hypothetical protein